MNEIAFSINPYASSSQNCLIVDLIEVVKEKFDYTILTKTPKRTIAQWQPLLQPAEKELFSFLVQEELSFHKQSNGKPPSHQLFILEQVHISMNGTFKAFEFLSLTRKLFHKGKQVVIDLFTPAEIYYEAQAKEKEQLEVTARLRWGDKDIALSECNAILPGKPHWIIYHILLKMVQPTVAWKKLQELYQTPLLLEKGAKQIFLDGVRDSTDKETPQLVLKGTSLEQIQKCTPYPLLMLKDRWGACADLWMDYGNHYQIAFHDPRSLIQKEKNSPPLRRNRESEANWEKDLLETDFTKKMTDSSHYYCPMDRIAKSLTFLLEIGWHIQDWQGKKIIKQTRVEVYLEEDNQAILVTGKIRYENHEVDVKNVFGAFNRKERFIALSPTTVGLLSTDNLQDVLVDFAEEGELVTEGIKIQKNAFGTLGSLWKEATLISPSLEELKKQWQDFKGIQQTPPSSLFMGHLRPYQQEGVNWLSFLYQYHFHGLLADEMGLGKTIQILAFLSRLPTNKPHLIILPTSLLFNWKQEIQQFLPSYLYKVHQGPQRSSSSKDFEGIHFILVSYTTLRLDLSFFKSMQYRCIILDEAQMIKNAHTHTAQAVCQLESEMRISLTGTPVENHLQELWSHFHFLIPSLFDSQDTFEASVQASQSDKRYLERIKKKIQPFLLRRRKQDVLQDLPSRIDQTILIEMENSQRNLYEQLLIQFKGGLLKKIELEGVKKHRMEILEALLRLRQVCCHPLLVSSLTTEEIPTSAKFEHVLQDLETIVEEGHKVLVYSQFTSMLKLFTKAANEKQWQYSYLDGQTADREKVVNTFQKTASQSIFFISLKAGGVGLNLTAADYVFLYDPWWNEAIEEQAISRAHRIGQKNTVITKRFVMAETIEEKMMQLKAAKRSLIFNILDSENTSLENLTMEDLQALFD